ncbi:MAG: glycosyltransferase family 4 protein, partial [Thermodesulfovibrionales bacterium]
KDFRMKILFINVLQSRHGSTFRSRNLSDLLARNHHVYYIEPNYQDNGTFMIKQRDSFIGLVTSIFKYLFLSLKIDFDILFLQKPWLITLPSLSIAKIKGKKVIIDFDDIDSKWQKNWLNKKLTALGERIMPVYADIITTHNSYLQNYLQSSFKKRVFLVPQGVDTSHFNPSRFNSLYEKERLNLVGKKVFCFLGSFTTGSSKDLHYILKAYSIVSKRIPNSFFIIIGGDGPLEDYYLNLIKRLQLKDVLITGRLDQSEVPRYLSAADYALIYMEDTLENKMRFSFKVMEYLSMKLTVIGHLVGATKDVFGKYCHLCQPGVESFAQKIIYVAENSIKKNDAREFLVKNYDWNVVGNYLDQVIKGLRL